MSIFRLSVSPIFLILAWINVNIPTHSMPGMMGEPATFLGMTLSSGTAQVLGSMWLMYALMGVAHATPWFSLIASMKSNGSSDF